MSQNRLLEKGGTSQISTDRQLRRRISIPREAADDREQPAATLTFVLPAGLEANLRRAVLEGAEVGMQRFLRSYSRPIIHRIHENVESPFELHFNFKLPHILYEGDRIKSIGDEDVQVLIRNSQTKEIITSGLLSCIWVKMIVLDGGFGKTVQSYRTMEELDSCKLSPRKGKGPLLRGDVAIKLKDGIGYFKDITFTDNSHCTTNGKFMLGAISHVMRSRCNGERIRGATSEAFFVKDRRGKSSRKPDSPAWTDDVCCLKNIRKDGRFHKRLNGIGIKTVLQFRKRVADDYDGLQKALGGRMTDKRWKETLEHAQKCELAEIGPSMPQLQTSTIPSSGLGEQNPDLLTTHQNELAAPQRCQNLANQDEFTAGWLQRSSSGHMHTLHQIQGSYFNPTTSSGALPAGPSVPIPGLQAGPTPDNQENPELLITSQGKLGTQPSFVHPANIDELMAGPSQHFSIGSTGHELQFQMSNPIQGNMLDMDYFLGQHIDYGYENSGTSEVLGSFEVGQNSLMEQDEEWKKYFASSPDATDAKKMWLKLGAVLKYWTIRKPIPQRKRRANDARKRWLKVGAVLMLAAGKPIDCMG